MTLWQKVVKYIKGLVHSAPKGLHTHRATDKPVPVLSAAGKNLELRLIASNIDNLTAQIVTAKDQKKKHSHLIAKRDELCARREDVEAGK